MRNVPTKCNIYRDGNLLRKNFKAKIWYHTEFSIFVSRRGSCDVGLYVINKHTQTLANKSSSQVHPLMERFYFLLLGRRVAKMAESSVSYLVQKLYDLVSQEASLFGAVEGEVRQLRDELEWIRLSLEYADEKRRYDKRFKL